MTENLIDLLLRDDISSDFDYHFNNFAAHCGSPEKNLMMSVLLYGVIDFISKDKRQFISSYTWIFEPKEDSDDWLFSFENICFTLGIRPSEFKEKLLQLKQTGDLDKKAVQLKHLNPAPGNRTRISVNPLYRLKKGEDE